MIQAGLLLGGSASQASTLWANRPPAASNAGAIFWCSDVVQGGCLLRSDGVNWLPLGGVAKLAQSATPCILLSNGSSNATGQITSTALPYTPSGVCNVYLPAGVVTAGSAGTGAGLYPAIFSSSGICQIQGTGIVTANTSFTQTTSQVALCAPIAIPAGFLGANGALQISALFEANNSANSKTPTASIGATMVWGAAALTTAPTIDSIKTIRNRGALNVQSVHPSFIAGAASGTNTVQTSIDFSVAQSLVFNGQLAVPASDYLIFDGYTIVAYPQT